MKVFGKGIVLLMMAILLLSGSVQLCFAQSYSHLPADQEKKLYTQEQVLQQFLQQKVAKAFAHNNTYAAKYNAVAFASFPRVFYEDTLKQLPDFNRPGALYRALAENTAEILQESAAAPFALRAEEVVQEIISHPRRKDVAHVIPFPAPGDMWYQAFALSSFYEQLSSFVAHPERTGINPVIFKRSQRKIEQFIKEYSLLAHAVIFQALAPLQTDYVEGADAQTYVRVHLSASLPSEVDKEKLIQTILEVVPTREQCYQQAKNLDPSFPEQLLSLAKVLNVRSRTSGQDWSKALSMFEYISPGVLVEKLQRFGHVPSRQEALDTLAAGIAAEALNRSLAQLANDLMEFEKPFYYSFSSFHNAERAIGQHWHQLATRSSAVYDAIGHIASANLLESGKWFTQDAALTRALQNRRIEQNIDTYQRYVPFVADVVGGEAIAALSVPLFSWSRLVEKIQVNRAMRAALRKQAQVVEKLDQALPATASNMERIFARATKATRLSDEAERSVFKIEYLQSTRVDFVKYGPKEELARTKQLDALVKKLNLRQKYSLIDIEYPQVIAESLDPLPLPLQQKITREINDPYLQAYLRSYDSRVQVPFMITEVDTKGVLLVDALENPKLLSKLGRKGISSKEWAQVEGFYRDLNAAGFQHTDALRNLYLRRLPNGRLKMTLLDFEWTPSIASDADILRIWKTVLQNHHLLR